MIVGTLGKKRLAESTDSNICFFESEVKVQEADLKILNTWDLHHAES